MSKELQILKEQQQILELRRQEESVKLEWLPFQNSIMDNLEKSRILPNLVERDTQTDCFSFS